MTVRQEDPVLTSARRESLIVFAVFLIAMTYTVTYCARHAYDRTAEDLTYVLGFPDWVFWGIVVPWLCCSAFSIFFGAWFMQDDDLGQEPEGAGDDDFGLGG